MIKQILLILCLCLSLQAAQAPTATIITWDQIGPVAGYIFYESKNGKTWFQSFTLPPTAVVASITFNGKTYVQMTATNSIGQESTPSNILPLP